MAEGEARARAVEAGAAGASDAAAAEAGALERRPSPSVFRNRNVVLFFSGQLISNSGTWLQTVAQGVLVLHLTGRALLVGATSGALFLPVLVLAPIGGRLADRFDRRRLLIVTQCFAFVATAVLAVLAATGRASVGAIWIAAVVVGIQAAVFTPAMGALLPSLVEPDQLGQAIGLNSATYNTARALGPILATVAIGAVGFGLAFGLNAFSFLFLIGALLAMRVSERDPRPETPGRVRDAVRFVWRRPRIRLMLLGVIVLSMAVDPILTLAPVFAGEYGRPASEAGLLITVFGVGSITAAVTLAGAFRAPAGRRFHMLVVWVPLLAGGLAAFALSPWLALGLVGLFAAGVGFLASNTTLTTGVLEETPTSYRGRVMGLWTVCFLGTRPIASLLDGALADAFGPPITPIVLAVPLVVVGLLAARRLPAEAPGAVA